MEPALLFAFVRVASALFLAAEIGIRAVVSTKMQESHSLRGGHLDDILTNCCHSTVFSPNESSTLSGFDELLRQSKSGHNIFRTMSKSSSRWRASILNRGLGLTVRTWHLLLMDLDFLG